MKIHLGCGPEFLENRVNVDYSLGARVASIPVLGQLVRKLGLFNTSWHSQILVHDLTQPLPWDDASVSVVYSSHTLEHLSREEGDALMGECARVLKPNGVLRFAVPDLEHSIQAYCQGQLPAEQFLEFLDVLHERRGSILKRIVKRVLDDGHTHKCMYDHEALIRLMSKHGLYATRRGAFESRIDGIQGIERLDRTEFSVVVEGVKPAVTADTLDTIAS